MEKIPQHLLCGFLARLQLIPTLGTCNRYYHAQCKRFICDTYHHVTIRNTKHLKTLIKWFKYLSDNSDVKEDDAKVNVRSSIICIRELGLGRPHRNVTFLFEDLVLLTPFIQDNNLKKLRMLFANTAQFIILNRWLQAMNIKVLTALSLELEDDNDIIYNELFKLISTSLAERLKRLFIEFRFTRYDHNYDYDVKDVPVIDVVLPEQYPDPEQDHASIQPMPPFKSPYDLTIQGFLKLLPAGLTTLCFHCRQSMLTSNPKNDELKAIEASKPLWPSLRVFSMSNTSVLFQRAVLMGSPNMKTMTFPKNAITMEGDDLALEVRQSIKKLKSYTTTGAPVATRLTHLQSLDITINDVHVEHFLRSSHWPKLTELDIHIHCTNHKQGVHRWIRTRYEANPLSVPLPSSLSSPFPTLLIMEIADFLLNDITLIPDTLKTLSIEWSKSLFASNMKQVLIKCTNLKKLSVVVHIPVDEEADVDYIIYPLDDHSVDDITPFYDQPVNHKTTVVQESKSIHDSPYQVASIKELSISTDDSSSHMLHDFYPIDLFDGFWFPCLERVHIRGMKSAHAVIPLLKQVPKLKEFETDAIDKGINALLQALARKPGVEHLTTVEFRVLSEFVQPNPLKELLQKCTNLVDLTLLASWNIGTQLISGAWPDGVSNSPTYLAQTKTRLREWSTMHDTKTVMSPYQVKMYQRHFPLRDDVLDCITSKKLDRFCVDRGLFSNDAITKLIARLPSLEAFEVSNSTGHPDLNIGPQWRRTYSEDDITFYYCKKDLDDNDNDDND